MNYYVFLLILGCTVSGVTAACLSKRNHDKIKEECSTTQENTNDWHNYLNDTQLDWSHDPDTEETDY